MESARMKTKWVVDIRNGLNRTGYSCYQSDSVEVGQRGWWWGTQRRWVWKVRERVLVRMMLEEASSILPRQRSAKGLLKTWHSWEDLVLLDLLPSRACLYPFPVRDHLV